MSILIEGMKLPEAKETFLRIDDKGNVKVYGNPTESYEAFPIPPHGRLIDVDTLDLDYEVEMADDWKTAHEIANVVKYAPTIIDAEVEQE